MKESLSIPFGYMQPDFKLSDKKRKKIRGYLPDISDDVFQTFIEHIESDISRYKGQLAWTKANKSKTEKGWNKKRVNDFIKHASALLDWLDAENDAASDMIMGAGLLLRHNEKDGEIETDKRKLRASLRRSLIKAETATKVIDRVISQGMDSTGSDARRGLIWNLAESYTIATGTTHPNYGQQEFLGIYRLIDDEICLGVGESSLKGDIERLRKFLSDRSKADDPK